MFFLFMGNSSNKKQVFHSVLLKARLEFYKKASTEFRTAEFVAQTQANLLEKKHSQANLKGEILKSSNKLIIRTISLTEQTQNFQLQRFWSHIK